MTNGFTLNHDKSLQIYFFQAKKNKKKRLSDRYWKQCNCGYSSDASFLPFECHGIYRTSQSNEQSSYFYYPKELLSHFA